MEDPEPLLGPFLRRLTRHSDLSAAEQRAIEQLPRRIEQVPAYQELVRVGRDVQEACYIVAGLVGRYEQIGQSRRQITGLHIAGELADLNSVVLLRASTTLRTLTDTTIVRLPHLPLRLLAGKFPGIARAFWRESALDAARLSRWTANLGAKGAVARTAHLICEMAWRYLGSPPKAFDLPLNVTQTDLADMLGLTRNHVNRTLKTLRIESVIASWDNSQLRVIDYPKLMLIAEFDPAYLTSVIPQQPFDLAEKDAPRTTYGAASPRA